MDGRLLENTVLTFMLLRLLCSLVNSVLHADIPVSLRMIMSIGKNPEVTSTTTDEFDTGVHMQFQNGE